jgi:hypothetical protein
MVTTLAEARAAVVVQRPSLCLYGSLLGATLPLGMKKA